MTTASKTRRLIDLVKTALQEADTCGETLAAALLAGCIEALERGDRH